MQNPSPDNTSNAQAQPVASDQNLNSGLQGQFSNVTQGAQTQLNNVGNVAQEQLGNVAQGLQNGVQDLGKAGVQQVQNLGQAGVQQVGSFFNQFTQPLTNQVVQPPVSKDEKIYGGLAYVPFIAVVCIILKPDSAFVRLHSKQGLLLSVIFFFVGILAAIVSVFGVIGTLLSFLLGLVPLGTIVIGLYSMYLALSGYWWKIPVLSAVADLIPVEMIAKASKENLTGQIGVAKEDYDSRKDAMNKEVQQNYVVQTPTIDPVANPNQQNIQK